MPYQCRLCKQTGHNRRTCKERQPTVVTNPSNEAETCPICMEILGKTNICTTKCGHQFCLKCMLKHTSTKDNCPLCRTLIDGVTRRDVTHHGVNPYVGVATPSQRIQIMEEQRMLQRLESLLSRI